MVFLKLEEEPRPDGGIAGGGGVLVIAVTRHADPSRKSAFVCACKGRIAACRKA